MLPSISPNDELPISDIETLKVIADRQRIRLLALLRRPLTVKALAAEMGVAPTRLYYHLNLLQEHGLVRVVDLHIAQGTVEKVYKTSARSFRIVSPLDDPGPPPATSDAGPSQAVPAMVGNRLADAPPAGPQDERQPPRYPFLTTNKLRLTDAQLTALHGRLTALLQDVANLARLNQSSSAPHYDFALSLTRAADEADAPAP